jgi:hypothetical protein
VTANPDLILAGVGASGTGGTSLSWWAPLGTTTPTSATASLDAAFRDGGLITEDGLSRGVEEESTNVGAYGLFVPARTLVTSSTITFTLAFLESNPTALSIYHRLPLTGDGSLSVAADGGFDFAEGASRSRRYTAVFDLVDGDNHVRAVCPSVEVTDRTELQIQAGQPVTYGVTCTAYAGSDGTAVHWYYLLDALAEGS